MSLLACNSNLSSSSQVLYKAKIKIILPFPPEITAIVADYCLSSHFLLTMPTKERNIFYHSFKKYFQREDIQEVLIEVNCLSNDSSPEIFCLETINKVYKFAYTADLLPKIEHEVTHKENDGFFPLQPMKKLPRTKVHFISQLHKICQQLGINSKKPCISSDLDISLIIDEIRTAINVDCVKSSGKFYLEHKFNSQQQNEKKIFKSLSISEQANIIRTWFDAPENENVLETVDALNAYNCHLITFPKEILKFKKIKYLDMTNNKIQHIPEQIGELTSLIKASFWNNRLNILPSTIKNLKNLNQLFIGKNNLTEIPIEIFLNSSEAKSKVFVRLPIITSTSDRIVFTNINTKGTKASWEICSNEVERPFQINH